MPRQLQVEPKGEFERVLEYLGRGFWFGAKSTFTIAAILAEAFLVLNAMLVSLSYTYTNSILLVFFASLVFIVIVLFYVFVISLCGGIAGLIVALLVGLLSKFRRGKSFKTYPAVPYKKVQLLVLAMAILLVTFHFLIAMSVIFAGGGFLFWQWHKQQPNYTDWDDPKI